MSQLERLVRLLVESDVDFVIVGGTAAVLRGAPIQTFDLDIVHRRSEANVRRLLEVLASIDAHARARPTPKVAPTEAHLMGDGHVLLSTELGPLDVLCTLEQGVAYEEIIADSPELDIAGMRVPVLSLERLIRSKRAAGRPKDLAVIPILEATLKESRGTPE